MKNILKIAAVALCIALAAPSASAWSIFDLFGGGNSTSNTNNTNSGSQQQIGVGDILNAVGAATGNSTAGNIIGAIGGVANALGANSNVSLDQIVGTWTYSYPAVGFKSQNMLLQAGGAAAATSIEKKIAPYYKKVGMNNLVLTINRDSTFNFQVKRIALGGVMIKNPETGQLIFQFRALNTIDVGYTEAFINCPSRNQMNLTFDISGLVAVINTLSNYTKNSTISTMAAVLNQYDGVTGGFRFTRK